MIFINIVVINEEVIIDVEDFCGNNGSVDIFWLDFKKIDELEEVVIYI